MQERTMNNPLRTKKTYNDFDYEGLDYDTDPITSEQVLSSLDECYYKLTNKEQDSEISSQLTSLLEKLANSPKVPWKEQETIKKSAVILREIIISSGNKNYLGTKSCAINMVNTMIVA